MGRKPRNYVKGHVYHLIQRGNNRANIFADQHDKAMLLNIIRMTRKKYPCYLLYYTLMDNHYHLVFEVIDTGLSIIMQIINQSYSKYYNKKYNRCGTIFGQRYAFYPVQNEFHFFSLLRYIAFNPVKANLVSYPAQYRWCAHLEIISGLSLIVSGQRLLTWFGPQDKQAAEHYKYFIEYADSYMDTAVADNPEDLIKASRIQALRSCFRDMVASEVLIKEIMTGRCSSLALEKKSEFIIKADLNGFTAAEIAHVLGISGRSVRRFLGARHPPHLAPATTGK